MVFSSRLYENSHQDLKDRFCEVEMTVAYRQVTCHNCDHTALYKYNVIQIRRQPEIQSSKEEEIRSDHRELWKTVPRFAEIPETVKCEKCQEVLGLYTSCIY